MDAESDEIRRTVTLTEQDSVAARRLHSRRAGLSGSLWKAATTLGLLVVIVEEFRTLTAAGVLHGLWLGLLTTLSVYAIFWLYYFLLLPSAARRAWRESPGQQLPTDYRMTADTLSYEQVDCSARMAWHTLTRWSADESCLILYNTPVTFYMLPRRFFSDDEVARLEAWLAQAGLPRY